jgi:hypothetical protein
MDVVLVLRITSVSLYIAFAICSLTIHHSKDGIEALRKGVSLNVHASTSFKRV